MDLIFLCGQRWIPNSLHFLFSTVNPTFKFLEASVIGTPKYLDRSDKAIPAMRSLVALLFFSAITGNSHLVSHLSHNRKTWSPSSNWAKRSSEYPFYREKVSAKPGSGSQDSFIWFSDPSDTATEQQGRKLRSWSSRGKFLGWWNLPSFSLLNSPLEKQDRWAFSIWSATFWSSESKKLSLICKW